VTRRLPSAPSWFGGAIGLVVVWEIVALTLTRHSGVVPTPVQVVRQLWHDRSLYPPNVGTTVHEAAEGWAIGNGLAIALAFLAVQVPALEQALVRVGIATYSLPIIAVAPILQVALSGSQPKIALAALAVFFTTMVSTLLGLRAAEPSTLDLVRAYGGGRFAQLRRVRMMAALPSVFAGLRIAAPAAVLGAIVGEWMGGTQGLGIAMVASEQSLQIARTWGLAIVAAGIGGVAYGLTSLAMFALLPWARRPGRQP
jgi:ABC-type nitrate/sulfonate/bicarbonate transport system permease component